jgi:hypothetical protein
MAELALYLDAARLGLMSSSARLAAGDFARLAGEEPFTLYRKEFLTVGSMTEAARGRYPGLDGWRGIRGLKQTIRNVTGVRGFFPVVFASRTSELMRLSARLLFRTCRNVLVTDTAWPPYRRILERGLRRQAGRVTILPIRRRLAENEFDKAALCGLFVEAYCRHDCDGLFLTAISHDGIRLPVREIVTALDAAADLRFIVIDGAQDLGHAPLHDVEGVADVYLAGCHKWIGAYQPLGAAVAGCPRSHAAFRAELHARSTTDPLLRFTEQLEHGQADGSSETANVAPLFSAAGALGDAMLVTDRTAAFATQLRNAESVAHKALESGWRPIWRPVFARSGILMLQAERPAVRKQSAEVLRRRFAEAGVLLTAYDQGQLRLSMPRRAWTRDDLDRLAIVFRSLA